MIKHSHLKLVHMLLTYVIRFMFEIKYPTIDSIDSLKHFFVFLNIVVTLLCVRSCLRPMSIKIRKAKNYASAMGKKFIVNAV